MIVSLRNINSMSDQFKFFERHEQSTGEHRDGALVQRRMRSVRALEGKDIEPASDEELSRIASQFAEMMHSGEHKSLSAVMNAITEICLRYPANMSTYLDKFNAHLQRNFPGIQFTNERRHGVENAVAFVVTRQTEQLPQGVERIIAVNDGLDALHQIDFVELRGVRNSEGRFITQECDLVQVKSATNIIDREKDTIAKTHQDWLTQFLATQQDIVRSRERSISIPEEIRSFPDLYQRVLEYYIDSIGIKDEQEARDLFMHHVLQTDDMQRAGNLLRNRSQVVRALLDTAIVSIQNNPALYDEELVRKLKERMAFIAEQVPALDSDLHAVPRVFSVISAHGQEVQRVQCEVAGAAPMLAYRNVA